MYSTLPMHYPYITIGYETRILTKPRTLPYFAVEMPFYFNAITPLGKGKMPRKGSKMANTGVLGGHHYFTINKLNKGRS